MRYLGKCENENYYTFKNSQACFDFCQNMFPDVHVPLIHYFIYHSFYFCFQFQSHQIFHVFVIIAAFVHYHGITEMAMYRMSAGECQSDMVLWEMGTENRWYFRDIFFLFFPCYYYYFFVLSYLTLPLKKKCIVEIVSAYGYKFNVRLC